MNYYDILGVDKTASVDEIRAAYKKAAQKHHPDKGGDSKIFQELQKAYEILSDPLKRQHYDEFGEATDHPVVIDQIITEVLMSIISGTHDIKHQNIITMLKNHFKHNQHNLKQQLKQLQSQNRKLRYAFRNIKAKNDILFNALKTQRQVNINNIRDIKHNIQIGEAISKRLNDYEYTCTIINPFSNNTITNSTTGTSPIIAAWNI